MELPSTGHDPVLLNEVLEYLAPPPDGVVVDCTTGRGGHSQALAQKLDQRGLLICLDADPRNLQYAKDRIGAVRCQIRFFHANFAELDDVLAEVFRRVGTAHQSEVGSAHPTADVILADLGISTNQLFQDDYGLSFSKPMPLDMRLDPRIKHSAADIINSYKEEQIADLLYELAQERMSRRIARKIVESRRGSPILTTDRLADIVRAAIGPRGGAPDKIDPATRTFMALRMAVNQELPNLSAFLKAAPNALKAGGRLGIISFHSGEDRMVKQAFRTLDVSGGYRLLTKKPIEPTEEETQRNPRARSAKMRVIEKLPVASC